MTASNSVGIVGLGLMGSALTERLIGAGLGVAGFDVDAEKQRAWRRLGGSGAASLEEVAGLCDAIFLTVFDTAQVEQVVESGLLPAAGPGSGKIILCASTCDPDRIDALALRMAPHGSHLLDTPISGTSNQVRQGRGVALVGGDAGKLDEVARILDAVFSSYFHTGPAGSAGRTKLAINLILGLNRLALAEGLVFAERLGLDPELFLKVARSSAAYSQVMEVKGSKMIHGEFTAEGRIAQHLKDVHLMLDQAQRLRQPLALLEVHAD